MKDIAACYLASFMSTHTVSQSYNKTTFGIKVINLGVVIITNELLTYQHHILVSFTNTAYVAGCLDTEFHWF